MCLYVYRFKILSFVFASFYSQNKTSLFSIIMILFSFSFASSWQLYSYVLKHIFIPKYRCVPCINHKWMLHSHARKEIHRFEEFIIQNSNPLPWCSHLLLSSWARLVNKRAFDYMYYFVHINIDRFLNFNRI